MELQYATPELAIARPRVLSVDVLRGIVMFTMVFVNDAYGATGSPWWLHHWDDLPKSFGPSGMTFVDVVFPAFLFIVGMSIPLALENRRAKGDSWLKIYGHVLLRTLSLLAIGVLMVEDPSDKKMHWIPGLWQVLMFGGVIVAFHSIRFTRPAFKITSMVVRALGGVLLIFLACKFRDNKGGTIQPSWWGILGLIGWAYFMSATVYLLLRNEGMAALAMAVGVLMCFYLADHTGTFKEIQSFKIWIHGHKFPVGSWLDIGEGLGSQASITMAGVVLGAMLLPRSEIQSPAARMRFAAVFAVLMTCGGLLLYKTYGISKDNATPTWCLFCSAITAVLWIALYAIVDVRGWGLGRSIRLGGGKCAPDLYPFGRLGRRQRAFRAYRLV